MIRFALIGSGAIAEKHAAAIAAVPGAELAAVWSRSSDRAARLAGQYGAEAVSELGELVVREDIHAATIATPSGAHATAVLPFLESGKAVLCEKPLEITLEKVDSMLEAARRTGAPLAAVLQLRLGAGAMALKQAVTEGRFGRLALCSAYLKWWRPQSYYDTVDWRGTWELDGGGALMNQGIHAVDLLQWLVGAPESVFAFSSVVAHERIRVEDTVSVALQYPHGAVGVIEASTACKPGYSMRIELCGDRGSAILEDDRIVRWQFDEEWTGDEILKQAVGGAILGGAADPRAIGLEGHRILVEDLVTAIQQKRPPIIPGAEARNAVRIILAAYESVREKRVVRLH